LDISNVKVVGVRTKEKNGYNALILGKDEKKITSSSKSEKGIYKDKVPAKVMEFRTDDSQDISKIGQDVPAKDLLELKKTAITQVLMPEVNDLINKQLEQFGITDPSQQELYREQIKQQLGVAPLTTEPLSATQSPALTTQEELLKQLTPQTSSSKQATSSSFINKLNSIPGLAQIQENYKDQLVNQMKNQLEEQVNGLVNKYAMYIPVLNAIAVFFLLSILNLPVMLLCIGLVVIVMDTLKFLKVIDVVKVKMEVERFAW
jgi:hypothetical protein